MIYEKPEIADKLKAVDTLDSVKHVLGGVDFVFANTFDSVPTDDFQYLIWAVVVACRTNVEAVSEFLYRS